MIMTMLRNPLISIKIKIIVCSVSFFFVAMLSEREYVQAEQLHLILAADTNSQDAVGNVVAADGTNLRNLMEDNVPRARLNVVDMADKRQSGSLMSKNDILNTIRSVNVAPDDCLFFFFSGHGAYDSVSGQYFQLANGDRPFRSEVLEAMKRKNARLSVLVTDCCNKQQDIPTLRPKPPGGVLMGTKGSRPLFEKLFFEAKGVVDITAAEKDSFGFIYPSSALYENGINKGSVFTWIFCKMLIAERDSTKNWQQMFEIVKKATNEDFQRLNMQDKQKELIPYAAALADDYRPSSVTGNKPRFGVRAEEMSDRAGVRVTEVIYDSPGESSGLRLGDIIIEINGNPVRNEQDYIREVTNSPLEMKFAVETAEGKTLDGKVTLSR